MEATREMLLACILGALPLLGFILWWWNEIWYAVPVKLRLWGTDMKLPPGHMGLPLLGELVTFLWYFKVRRRPDDFINSKRRKYGDGVGLYRTHLFGSPSIIACFPNVIKHVFQSHDAFILEWPNKDILGYNSLAVVQGKAHTRLRRFVVDAINKPASLRRIAALVQPRMVAALESWASIGKIRVRNETKKFTFQTIGILFASFEPGPLLDTMDELFHGLVQGLRAQPFKFPGTAYYHACQCRKKLEEIFREQLEIKKKNMEQDRNTEIDLMDGLMQMKDEEGNRLSDQEVLDNIVNLIVAGYETTAVASMWAMYYLAKYPDVLKRLREENIAINQMKKEGFITIEDVSKLNYTNKVVEETIRMANVAAIIFRLATREVEYKGYTIPKNWKVLLWIRYLHTNPENFDDPICFNPDRWNEAARPGTYQVFGGGHRICAGNMLARIELALFLHHLSIGYRWELINPDARMIYLSHPAPIDGVEVSISKI
ncbi:hypothetical protein K2173_027034 [Erythroxylum novogranatense]|uniref:Ent-kaurenoic acid oxidase n=1 Tax=Erythroxylum novogranatense TaxID=1862640 RepID=A0AAV8TY52_9ROSI|nr:hypothetical protein K2173_027034 [Erythroxylum novogranatense]